ncbi:hypothetical protein BgiBS90_028215, partial [Biomphalaria glabrata]
MCSSEGRGKLQEKTERPNSIEFFCQESDFINIPYDTSHTDDSVCNKRSKPFSVNRE